MRGVLFICFLCLLTNFNPAMGAAKTSMHFRSLPASAIRDLDNQRAYVRSLVSKHLPGKSLSRTKADLFLLQSLIDLKLVGKDQTWELQALGVVFGDALANIISGLSWVEVTDEFGTDPTLRYKSTSLQINALTMISKRMEEGEEVDVEHMASWIQDFVANKSHEYQ